MNISHISVSRKLVFDECEQRYKYKYHLKIVSPEDEPFYFVYGNIVHKICEEFVRGRGKRKLVEVRNDVLEGRIPIEDYKGEQKFAPKIPHAYRVRMPGHLTSLAKLTERIGYDGDLEWKFRYDLDPPNEKFITGYIDRLIKKDDTFFIIDYKTSKKGRYRKTLAPGPRSIVHDLQLRCYAKVVQKEFNVPAENIKAALYYLEGGNLVGAKFSQDSLDSAEAAMLNVYDRIVATNPDKVRGTVGQHCNRCDYCSICPFVKGIG